MGFGFDKEYKPRTAVSESQIDTIADIAERINKEQNRRQRQSNTINELLRERQEVLVCLCELAEVNGTDDHDEAISSLRAFIQTLVDYTALGHFEIYERMLSGKERRSGLNRVMHRVYPTIASTTQAFVDFNDKYEGIDELDGLSVLNDDLSQIGENMAERIESEDLILRELSVDLESPSEIYNL